MRHNDVRRNRHSAIATALIAASAFALTLLIHSPARAQQSGDTAVETLYTSEDLEQLVGPIALYPDDLIASSRRRVSSKTTSRTRRWNPTPNGTTPSSRC